MELESAGDGESLSIRPWADAYHEHRGMLLRTLGNLAGQGWAVPPDEGLDLIHSFFVEAWEGIQTRFDPSIGPLSPYLRVAFEQFARPRIIRLNRFRHSLVEPEVLNDVSSSTAAPDRVLEDDDLLHALGQGLEQLPDSDRELLLRYFDDNARTSERTLAVAFNTSRYALRSRLVDALGRLSVHLGKPPELSDSDWQAALAVWRDGLTIEEAAATLGMTAFQVRSAQRRNQARLAEGLAGVSRPRPRRSNATTQESTGPREQSPPANVEDRAMNSPASGMQRIPMPRETPQPISSLLNEFFRSPRDPHLRQQLQERGEEVVALFDDPARWSTLEVGTDWDDNNTQAVYEALAAIMGEPEAPAQTNPLWQAYVDDRSAIGHAFDGVLVPALPHGIAFMMGHFSNLPRVSEEFQAMLRKDADVRDGGPSAAALVPFGVTPVVLLRTTDAIGDVLDRATDLDLVSPNETYMLSQTRGLLHQRGNDVVVLEHFTKEISAVCGATDVFAKACFSWAVAASGHVPQLIDGYQTSLREGGVSLHASTNREKNLLHRWRPAWHHAAAHP